MRARGCERVIYTFWERNMGVVMRKKPVLVLILVIVLVTGVVSFIQWRYGVPFTFLASGSLYVGAYLTYPSQYTDRPNEFSTKVDLFANGKKIGESGSYINLLPGQYLISFGDYNDTYETPQPQEITIKHHEKTYIKVSYVARYGILRVTTGLYNDYTETYTPVDADIFIDGEWRGNGSLSIVFDETELGYHTVYFSATSLDLEGYADPYNTTALVEKGKTTLVTCQYNKILSAEEQEYCSIRNKVRSLFSEDLDPDSNYVTDNFYSWVLENKIRVPVYYMYAFANPHNPKSGYMRYKIAQYAGVLLDERIDAFQNFYQNLLPVGIDLLGTRVEHAIFYRGVIEMCYNDQPEKIFAVELEYELDLEEMEEVEGGEIYRFYPNNLANLTSLFPSAIPAGIGIWFGGTKEVYVSTNGLEKLTIVYPDFREFSNLEEWDKGWYHATWRSFSVQPIIDFYFSDAISQLRQLISAFRLGTILLDPGEFLESIRLLS